MHNHVETNVSNASKEKESTKPVIRKVEPRRWNKAIAPNHNNHNHTGVGAPIAWR